MDDDQSLLKAYVAERSERAFARLVDRYVDLIYAAARRQVGDEHLAQDVTQEVFVVLARRAHAFRDVSTLHGWLLKTTYYLSHGAVRARSRRQRREEKVARTTMQRAKPTAEAGASDIEIHLDRALSKLSAKDSSAVVLRYFEGKSLLEIARITGGSLEATTKRTTRAIAKLRKYFADRGIVLAVAGVEMTLAEAGKMHAPVDLAARVSANAFGTPPALMAGAGAKLAVVGGLLAAIAIAIAVQTRAKNAPPPTRINSTAPTTRPLNEMAVSVRDASLDGYPIPKPWPMGLPGQVCGTPVVADLLGDGKREIIVTCKQRGTNNSVVYSEPNPAALVFALRMDGTVLPGWPIDLTPAGVTPSSAGGSGWASSPSVFRRNGRDELALNGATGGTRIINAQGIERIIPGGVERISVPLADLDGDGIIDLVDGQSQCNVDGTRIASWPQARKLRNGFCPCIGDALGDGKLKLYHLFYGGDISDVGGFDADGNRLAGWPQKIGGVAWFPPVMGDIEGDGKMEVIGAYGDWVFAFTWDGKPLTCDHTEPARVPLKGVFKSNVSAAGSSPTLADLDGDGKAEIIVCDQRTSSIRAWHGDGRGMGNDDGIIAQLPMPCFGVSVANLSGGDLVDLFAGCYWVKYNTKSGKSEIVNMCPGDVSSRETQPTICDVDGDGKADVIFGLSDGRVFIYNTGLAYRAELIQWATCNGNFQHTGCWKKGH